MKLGTRMQVLNTNTPTKFQGHSTIMTPLPLTSHLCGVQGH